MIDNPTMKVCEKCWQSNAYTHSTRCEEHKDLPAGCMGAVPVENEINIEQLKNHFGNK